MVVDIAKTQPLCLGGLLHLGDERRFDIAPNNDRPIHHVRELHLMGDEEIAHHAARRLASDLTASQHVFKIGRKADEPRSFDMVKVTQGRVDDYLKIGRRHCIEELLPDNQGALSHEDEG